MARSDRRGFVSHDSPGALGAIADHSPTPSDDATWIGNDLGETGERAISTEEPSTVPFTRNRTATGDDALQTYGLDDEATGVDQRPTDRAFLTAGVQPTLRAEYRREPGLVAGRYRILLSLATGGMGTVYEAEHVELRKRVAVKILHLADGPSGEVAARFKREARSASSLDHDHIVKVFDAGEDPTYGLFMVMELLKGEDLERVISTRGPLDPRVAARVVHEVCLALDAAHAAHILHRDLKPANIFLAKGNGDSLRTKIVDFGLAKLVRDASGTGRGNLTRAGIVLGTPQYMSPEQAQGLDSVDQRADIYALGAVFYEALVGRTLVPEYSSYERTLYHIMTQLPPRVSESLPTVHPALDDLIASMLLPRGERIASARKVVEKLFAIYPDLERTSIVLPAGDGATATRRPVSGAVPSRRRHDLSVSTPPEPRYAAALAPPIRPVPTSSAPPAAIAPLASAKRPDLARTLLIAAIALLAALLAGLVVAFFGR